MKKLTVVGAIVGALLFTLSMGTTAIAAEDYYEFSEYSGPGAEYDVACYGNTIYYGAGTYPKIFINGTDKSTGVTTGSGVEEDNNYALTVGCPNDNIWNGNFNGFRSHWKEFYY